MFRYTAFDTEAELDFEDWFQNHEWWVRDLMIFICFRVNHTKKPRNCEQLNSSFS